MASAALASSFVATSDARSLSLLVRGGESKLTKKSLLNFNHSNKSPTLHTGSRKLAAHKRKASVYATYSGQDGRPSSASIFVGGFVLGGVIVGALGCVFAPQLSKALTGDDRKELLRRLPKFIYDEEKTLEKTRKAVEDKIAELNDSLDDISSKIRAERGLGPLVSDDYEASV